MKYNEGLPFGATPLDPNETNGLLINGITTHGELNTAEQEGILNESQWIFGRNHKHVLTDAFFKELHKRMFSSVWKWAGKYRQTDKNIGVDKHQISIEVKKICDDTAFWIESQTYPWNELGARFHHRVVWIHPFPNGNGRFSRILTDILMKSYEQAPFTWGQKSGVGDDFVKDMALRKEYITALQEADQKNYARLIKFMMQESR